MAIMFTGKTYDHAKANNYSLYNQSTGLEIAKYTSMTGIVEARCNPGYMFKEDSFKTKKGSTDRLITIGILSPDKRTYTFNIDDKSMGSDFTALTEAFSAEPTYHQITQEEINALFDRGFLVFVEDTQAVADTDYLEKALVTVKLIDREHSKITDSDYPIDPTKTFITVDNWYEVDLGKIRIEVYVEPYTFDQSLIDSYLKEHIIIKIDGKPVTSDKYYSTSKELVFEVQGGIIKRIRSEIVDDNYIMVDPPVIANNSRSASYSKGFKPEWLDYLHFTIETDTIIDVDIPEEGDQSGDPTRSTMDIYRMNPDDVYKFVSEFHGVYFDSLGGTSVTVDYSKFILSLIRLPFPIKEHLVKEENATITLGRVKTAYKADRLKIDTLKFNIGEIHTPAEHGNLLDFANTSTVLHIPFLTPIGLDTRYVVGKTIQIELIINLTNGDCDIHIRSDALDEGNGFGIIASANVDLNVTIPWGRTDAPTGDPRSVGIVTDNDIRQAYVEVIRNKPTNINGKWTVPIIDERKLLPSEGYVEVDHIDLVSKASRVEKLMIQSALSSGVIIK